MSLKKITIHTDPGIKELAARIRRIDKRRFLFDRELSRDYELVYYYHPMIFFKCIGEPFYSFKIHKDLFNAEEREFWNKAAKKQERVLFNGNVTRGYNLGIGIGSLRGYISTLTNNRRIGVYARNGVVKDLLTEDELVPYQAWLAESIDTGEDNSDNTERGQKKNAKKK